MSENEPGAMTRMRCREIMSARVKTAGRATTLQEVAAMMRDGDMGAMPVVEDGKLVGIVTDRDIVVRAIAEGRAASTPIGEAMTTEIFYVRPDDFVFEAVRLMGDKQVRRIPVVERERRAGRYNRDGRYRTRDGRRARDSRDARRDLERKRFLE